MSEDQSEVIEKTSSQDVTADPSTATPEAEASTEVQTEASAAETPEPKKLNGTQKRINQLTRKNYEEKQRADELEQRLKALETKQQAPTQPDLVAPKQDDFNEYSDFEKASSTFIAENAANIATERLETAQKGRDQQAQVAVKQQAMVEKKATFDKHVESKIANFEDFDEIAYGNPFMDADLAEQIFDMGEKAPEVAYHIGSNLDVAEKLLALNPVQRARELTKLEFSLEALAPKKVSGAPDPITSIGNSEKVDFDPMKLTPDEWQAWRNKQVHG
ncbi:MAG: hypothetical protein V3R25_09165 [Nitrosomonadaceae bacterium]